MRQPSSFNTIVFLLHPTLTDRGTYGGDVIGLQVKDDFLHSLDAFFHSEVHLVVFTADVSCNLTNTSQRTINEQQADVLKLLNLLKGETYWQPSIARTDLASSYYVWTVLRPDRKCLNRILQLLLLGQFHQCSSNQTGVQTTWRSWTQTKLMPTCFTIT